MQCQITKPSRLLNHKGELIQKGYATSPLLKYERENVRVKLRLKEWDYYLIYNGDFGLAVTVGSTPGIGLLSVTLIDFGERTEITKSLVRLFPVWNVKMPESSVYGDIEYQDDEVSLLLINRFGERSIEIEMKNFNGGSDLKASVVLTDEPTDSMVIATSFKHSEKEFFYNRKIIGMTGSGSVFFRGSQLVFTPGSSFGLLDWGRGVWPYKTTWYWSAGQGLLNNDIFGFNLGYGFGDTSCATENMVFWNGKANKLENVIFIIPKTEKDQYDYLKPWVITSSDKRFEAEFFPILDRSVKLSVLLLATEQHQVFGKFRGTAQLDDGRIIDFNDFLGFAEKVENRW